MKKHDALDLHPIFFGAGETIHSYPDEHHNFLCSHQLENSILINFIGKNGKKSLSNCPCLIFLNKKSQVKFYGQLYLKALLERELKWLGELDYISLVIRTNDSLAVWYLSFVEIFFIEQGYNVKVESENYFHLSEYKANEAALTSGKINLSEVLLKILILGAEKSIPYLKYDRDWLPIPPFSSYLAKEINLQNLLSPQILDRFAEKYHLKNEIEIIKQMICSNFKSFLELGGLRRILQQKELQKINGTLYKPAANQIVNN